MTKPIQKDKFFSPRETAILRHVWFLQEDERKLLDLHYLRKAKILDVLHFINHEAHDFRDILLLGGVKYEVEYHRTTDEHLESLSEDYPDMEVFLSVRRRESKNFAVVLLWPIFEAKHDPEFLKKLQYINLTDFSKEEVEE